MKKSNVYLVSVNVLLSLLFVGLGAFIIKREMEVVPAVRFVEIDKQGKARAFRTDHVIWVTEPGRNSDEMGVMIYNCGSAISHDLNKECESSYCIRFKGGKVWEFVFDEKTEKNGRRYYFDRNADGIFDDFVEIQWKEDGSYEILKKEKINERLCNEK